MFAGITFGRYWVVVLFTCALAGPAHAEEFAGPFPSWRNLKTDYGAVGDGLTDDASALQRALDDLVLHQDFCVLYVPAGQYRLTRTVKTLRHKHTDCNGIAIIGESPETTIFRWDGPAGGTVVNYDAWYSKISRLTIDGAGRAGVALAYGPSFSTYNESSDLVLRDAGIGLLLGDRQTMGQAENEVLRCHFSRCSVAGIRTGCFNTLDIWVWYCSFEDCGYGLYNGAGAFLVWQNVFLRSTTADIGIQNHGVFSFVNNTSLGSRRFLQDSGQRGGDVTTITGNRILNPTADFPLLLGPSGPYLVMDNVFKLAGGSTNRAVKMSSGVQTFVGNTYTAANAVQEAGSFRRVAEQVVGPQTLADTLPGLPPVPEHPHRQILEVPAGADGRVIQSALDAAEKWRGARPIVHLPKGDYRINRTLVISAGSDVQLVGDGAGSTCTVLNWAGRPGGLLLKLAGPSRATLKDICLNAASAQALLVDHADQPGGRIFADQLNVNGPYTATSLPSVAIHVNGLAQTDVLFRCLEGAGNSGRWLEVTGSALPGEPGLPPGQVAPPRNQISVLAGVSSPALGHYSVNHGGALLVRSVYHEHSQPGRPTVELYDSGTLALDACWFTYEASPRWPMFDLHDFHGAFTLAGCLLNPLGDGNACRLEISGAGAGTHALLLNNLYNQKDPGVSAEALLVNHAQPPAAAGIIGCGMNLPVFKGTGLPPLADLWTGPESRLPDMDLLRHLEPFRAARVWLPVAGPAHVTELRIYRVRVEAGSGEVVEFRAGA